MINSFRGTVLTVGNDGVRSVVDEILHFRTQITRTDEIRNIGGWMDPLNEYLATGLGRIRQTLSVVTHQQRPVSPDGSSSTTASAGQAERQRTRNDQAADENLRLRALFLDEAPLAIDDTQMPASNQTPLPYDFSGADPDLPQMSNTKFKNIFLTQFVTCLDTAVRELTGLSCADSGSTIPQDESVMIHNRLQLAFAILETKGGSANRPKILNGKDPDSLKGKVGPTVEDVVIEEPAADAVQ